MVFQRGFRCKRSEFSRNDPKFRTPTCFFARKHSIKHMRYDGKLSKDEAETAIQQEPLKGDQHTLICVEERGEEKRSEHCRRPECAEEKVKKKGRNGNFAQETHSSSLRRKRENVREKYGRMNIMRTHAYNTHTHSVYVYLDEFQL